MDATTAGIVGTWTVLVVPFVVFAGYLHSRGDLTPLVVAIYWYPPLVLTVIGVIPPPWRAVA